MRNGFWAAGLLAATLATMAAASPAWAQSDVIAARREGFKRMGGHMEAIKAVVDSRGATAPLAPRVEDMVAWFGSLPERFPAGSDKGDTRALPSVWSDRPGFTTAAENATKAAQALQVAVAGGDVAQVQQAFGAMGGTCGACHRGFRGR